MLLKTRGIVIRSIKYSETSLIVDVYTEEKGLRTYIVSGVRSKKSKVSASLLQVMSLLDMVVYHRDDKNLARTKEIKAAHIYNAVPFNIKKSSVGLFMAEIIQKTLTDPEENKPLFEFIFNAFIFLDQTEENVANLHLSFMIYLMPYLGFMPGGEYSEATPFFDLKEGHFTGSPENVTLYIKDPLSAYLGQLMKLPFHESHQLKISKTDRKLLLNDLLKFYRLHIENFGDIQSHIILEAVFGS